MTLVTRKADYGGKDCEKNTTTIEACDTEVPCPGDHKENKFKSYQYLTLTAVIVNDKMSELGQTNRLFSLNKPNG